MIDDKQRHILEAVVQVLEVAGIHPWFEARIIKDSDKKLNGKRISSRTRTDLASVLAVADKRKVGMQLNMRMELRMYATLAGSRSVFMGQEMTGAQADTVIPDEAAAAAIDAVKQAPPVVVGVDQGRPGDDTTVVMVRQGDQLMTLKEAVQAGVISDSEAAMHAGLGTSLLTGEAHYSPAKNVERLRAEGVPEEHPLMRQAKRKVVLLEKPVPPALSETDFEITPHTCDANGPMRQQSPDGPFLATCSLCGEFNAGST